ncbi:pentapeptide repeat-containing protein [Dankookia rubra]|uniref:Pentapeptide repeat-containing protein n=1 Tax=Dankookia rubra TaxID=1442381 RepID=A0A4R5QPL2_9PROT|nr:pentapeptide repeat-containing protein [Dankookia rubra]
MPCRADQARARRRWGRGPPGRLEEFASRSISAGVRTPFLLLPLLLLHLAPVQAAQCAAQPAPGIDWRRCLLEARDLRNVDLTGAVLRDASLSNSDLRGATLRGVVGYTARFVAADLRGADLTEAELLRADMTRANLSGARLVGADLRRIRFFRADLRGADLTAARLEGADLLHAQLEGARWIDGTRLCAAGSVGACR